MKNRYCKLVLEAEEGIIFETSEGENGELIIKASLLNTNEEESYLESQDNTSYEATNSESLDSSEASNETSEISETSESSELSCNYETPPIPDGYKHICGEWNDGFVIERSLDGSQFVWIPVGSLDPDGTLNGKDFSEKFGRRNYQKDDFSESGFHEELTDELVLQIESVEKYGGFYISRYNISENKKTRKLQSVKGAMPLVNIGFYGTMQSASEIEATEAVKSHLIFGAEYDSVLAWLIKSGAKTLNEIAENSSSWGNFWNYDEWGWNPKGMPETGSSEEWKANNIYDLAGQVAVWTQEEWGDGKFHVIRNRCCVIPDDETTVAYRDYSFSDYGSPIFGFRVGLYIK